MIQKSNRGFTIVELIIVIIVIGILAAIVLVAYNGIAKKATISSITSDLKNSASVLEIAKARTKQYPATAAEADYGIGLPSSAGNSLTYHVSPDQNEYCLQGSHEDISLYVTSNDTTPAAGTCSGDLIAWEDPSEPDTPPDEDPDPPASCPAYAIGDTGPGGGTIFYVASTPQSWGCYLEAAPTDQPAHFSEYACMGMTIAGADGTAIGTGQQNTLDILAAGCSPTHGHDVAAAYAHNYSHGGKTDWFLPSRDELSALADHTDVVGIPSGSYWYWSSTEVNANNACIMDIAYKNMNCSTGTKSASPGVIPIRAF